MKEIDTDEKLRHLIRSLIELYTTNRDDLMVDVTSLSSIVLIEVKADLEDHRKIIGVGGRNVNTLKSIIDGMAQNTGVSMDLRIAEPHQFTGNHTVETSPDVPKISKTLRDFCTILSGDKTKVVCKRRADEEMGDKYIFEIILHQPIEMVYQENLKHMLKLIGSKCKSRFYADFVMHGSI